MNSADTPATRKLVVSRKWLALSLTLVIGIASLLGYYWAKSQGWRFINTSNADLISNYVEALSIDNEERVWVGTPQGLSVLAKGKWTNYLAGVRVLALVVDAQGQTWIGTDEGLSVFTADGGLKTYTTANSGLVNEAVLSLAIDTQGQAWIGTAVGLNLLTPDGSWKVYTTHNSDLPDDSILALGVDPQNRVWIGTDDGLSVLTSNGQWKTYTESNSELAGDRISSLAIDAEGSVWAGNDMLRKGLSVLSPDGQWRVYTESNSGLASDMVTALLIDDRGSVWVGNHFTGLSELMPEGQWKRYSKISSGLNDNYVNTLAYWQPSPGKLWVGSSNGLAIYSRAESVPQNVIFGSLLLGLLSLTALIIQVVIYSGMAWEKKRQKKPISSGEDSPLETAPAAPEADRRRKYILFASGFLGWYLVNGLLWLAVTRDGFSMEGSGMLNLCFLPINLILLVVFSRKHSIRFIGLGILSALAVNLFISLILGMATNAGCFIPFFIKT
jgi:sugar lactone lactonase YvrE